MVDGLTIDDWRLEISDCRLGIGDSDWRLAIQIGDWRLGIDDLEM
jgi:hypothetical protein